MPKAPITIPWDYVRSTENHGPYITSRYGRTICNFYFMSTGPFGTQALNPIHHMFDLADDHAAYAVRAVNAHGALVEALKKIDAYWTEDFPEGPDGDTSVKTGIFSLVGAKLSDSTLEIWREIRSALELAAEVPAEALRDNDAPAPDLLRSLKELLNLYADKNATDEQLRDYLGGVGFNAVVRARAAVTAAEGRS
jgi:hypothetical protein